MTIPEFAALPFTLSRQTDVFGNGQFASTTETVHGLLRLEKEELIIQWRVLRETDRFGAEIRSDTEVEPVREVAIPLSLLASASVRTSWWGGAPRLVLTAADLGAFEALAGPAGLGLSHPAELVLTLRRGDRYAAREFSTDVSLAVGEQALRLASESNDAPARLPRPRA